MVRGLLLDFHGTVVEDDDALVAAIAAQVAADATTPVTPEAVAAAWMREFATVAEGPPFRLLRDSAPESLARVMTEVGCPGDPAALYAAHHATWRLPRAPAPPDLARLPPVVLVRAAVAQVPRPVRPRADRTGRRSAHSAPSTLGRRHGGVPRRWGVPAGSPRPRSGGPTAGAGECGAQPSSST
ncbi:hypothetical protein [Micromonospora sp. KC723]|uniref:hypothetical protein n=1 Tax=Micromonospora sp. KC723 TaxID=2530381 RepID=UPI0010484537|nr:hypothetical protein [Micromonospora sp. KC723]TDB75230.1 hypothetical protein E1165_11975 [Micromonospora sp. KC723]